MRRPLVIAHRGLTKAGPENSLAALAATAGSGADGVEIDVRAARDGGLFLWHDEHIDGGPFGEIAQAEVRGKRLPNGEAVPTLSEGLAALGTALDVFVEIKSLPAALDATFLDLLSRGPAPARYRVHAFDHRIIQRLHDQQPSLPGGVLQVSHPIRPLAPLHDAAAVALWQAWQLIDQDLVDTVHRARAHLYAWTVNEAAALTRLATLGVDGLCTDEPELARHVVDSLPRQE